MEILDWLFVSFISGIILSILLLLVLLFLRFSAQRKILQLENQREKSKGKRRRRRRELRNLEKKQKRNGRLIFTIVFVAVLLSGGAFGVRYYTSTHLDKQDSEFIVRAYYLLDEAETYIQEVNHGENPTKARNNLREVAARMASFGVYRANGRLELSGQQELNRYYISIKELGLNLANQTTENLQDSETYEVYLADIEKTTQTQKKLFEKFKINESALKAKK